MIMSPRLTTARSLRPNSGPSVDELQVEDVRVNFRAVPREFLANHNLPVDPNIVAKKEEAYQREVHRWADLED